MQSISNYDFVDERRSRFTQHHKAYTQQQLNVVQIEKLCVWTRLAIIV